MPEVTREEIKRMLEWADSFDFGLDRQGSIVSIIRRLAAAYLAQHLVWSDKPPDKDGQWWNKNKYGTSIIELQEQDGKICEYHYGKKDWVPVYSYGQWAGPIPEPESSQ